MQRAFVISLLLALVGGYGFAQTDGTASSRARNLRDCIDGFGTCDRSQLTSAQASQLANLQHEQNLWVCLTGNGECTHSMLTARERFDASERYSRDRSSGVR
jgi:hypothetical protein